MANIVTSEFRARNATSFIDEVGSNNYWTFVSSAEEPEIEEEINSEYAKRVFLEKTLFGKEVSPNDVLYMVKNTQYTPGVGVVYDAYDDKADMTNKNFFVTVYPEDVETGSYFVFKCLSNNYGAAAVDPIVYNPSIPDQRYIQAGDGYIWKYMYTLTNNDFRTYFTNNLIPITEDAGNNQIVDGIEAVLITNPGESFGYKSIDGIVTAVTLGDGVIDNISISSINGVPFAPQENYYAGQSISITKDVGDDAATVQYTISGWEWTGVTSGIIRFEEVVSTSNTIFTIDNTCTIKIAPRIEIIGDGAGAKAIPVIDQNGKITDIQMISIGEGYTSAIARVVDPIGFETLIESSNGARCLIRPIISPNGGHGNDLKTELLCQHIIINTEISSIDNFSIPTSGAYTKLGLVKNPSFDPILLGGATVFDNRLRIKLTDVSDLSVGDILFQVDPTDPTNPPKTFEGKIHSIDGTDVYLINYVGIYQNQANSDISFDGSLQLSNEAGKPYNIALTGLSESDVTLSPYQQRSGEVFYINTFNPIERTALSLEQYKILLKF